MVGFAEEMHMLFFVNKGEAIPLRHFTSTFTQLAHAFIQSDVQRVLGAIQQYVIQEQ